MRIDTSDDTQYGSAGNGTQVGSGYDVVIKRESERIALVNVTEVATSEEWLGELPAVADEDLQGLAVQIGNCPGEWLHDLESNDPDTESEWDHYANRWNAIDIG